MDRQITVSRPPSAATTRVAFVDNLRWLVIIMVVLVHACVTYSGIGSWFYVEPTELDVASALAFVGFEAFSQAFFMGLMFLIAAMFIPKSYDRKGFGRFIRDRVVRLGVPTALFMFILDPTIRITEALFRGDAVGLGSVASAYLRYLTSAEFLSHTGPLWFALALLIFTTVYALVRLVADGVRAGKRAGTPARNAQAERLLAHGPIAAIVGAIALCSFLVRLVQPFGTAWYNMQLCYFSQYVVLFVIGLWIGKRNLLQALPTRLGRQWLTLAVGAGIPLWFLLVGFGGALSGSFDAYGGGWHWQAAAYTIWESFFAVGFSLGLIVLYRERMNVRGSLTAFLSDNSFGVYCFHAPILVAISMAIMAVAIHPLAKAALVGIAAIAISYFFTAFVRAIPGLRRIFS